MGFELVEQGRETNTGTKNGRREVGVGVEPGGAKRGKQGGPRVKQEDNDVPLASKRGIIKNSRVTERSSAGRWRK